MQLWILEYRPDIGRRLGYDCAYGFIVRAATEGEARQLASWQAGNEGRDFWLDEKYSTCEPLKESGKAGIIMSDFLHG